MTHILMIGDSLGCPEFVPDNLHTEYHLKELGYKITNLSKTHTPNRYHIDKLAEYYNDENNLRPDFLIWFHNNTLGTVIPKILNFDNEQRHQSFSKILENAHISAYNRAAGIKNKFRIPWFVIGGGGPLSNLFYKYNLHDECIHCWRSQIANEDLPDAPVFSYTTDTRYLVHELNSDSIEYKQFLLKNAKIIHDKITDHKELFPDGWHPGIQPHVKLTMVLHEWIQKHLFYQKAKT